MNTTPLRRKGEIHQEDAMKHIIKWGSDGARTEYSNYGYELYIPNIIRAYIASLGIREFDPEHNQLMRILPPVFLDAAWELCRRGIIRPGIRNINEQATPQGSAGSGFSFTLFGRQWIQGADQEFFVPTEPERFAQMIAPFRERFGPGFHSRAQEAVRCYGARTYLACCTMCGAAAESILLAAAIAKVGDEEHVLKLYTRASGHRETENILIGKAREQLQREFRGLIILLNYWRDEAAHGTASTIEDNQAYTALAMLLRFAMFVNTHWDELTS